MRALHGRMMRRCICAYSSYEGDAGTWQQTRKLAGGSVHEHAGASARTGGVASGSRTLASAVTCRGFAPYVLAGKTLSILDLLQQQPASLVVATPVTRGGRSAINR